MGSRSKTMCFSQEMSGLFSVLGALFALWVARSNGNTNVVKGIMYFVAMETLQYVQFFFIAEDVDPLNPTLAQIQASPACNTQANRFLTFVGLAHICFQPFYSAHLSCAFVTSSKNVAQFELVKRLQLVGGVFLMSRWFLTLVDLKDFGVTDSRYFFDAESWAASSSVEWLVGPALCTYKGVKHLAWSVPMVPVSYYSPSMALHAFLMFMPFFVMDHGSTIRNIPNWIAGSLKRVQRSRARRHKRVQRSRARRRNKCDEDMHQSRAVLTLIRHHRMVLHYSFNVSLE